MSEFKVTIEDILGESGELTIEKELASQFGGGVNKRLVVIAYEHGYEFNVKVHGDNVLTSKNLQSAIDVFNNRNGLK